MDIIRLLPPSVANQIAAGEVVQRPASAVKELLENAMDAGADVITLVIKDSGKTLIQVTDNGKGMSPNDARLAFERHATSKITVADDLFNIKTKGFRGEALASIAAIAQVELKTRLHTTDIGTKLIVEGSEIKHQEPDACASGTTISVRNLFYNVPARRNFLKSDTIEFKHILDDFIRVAMAHPDVKFELYHNHQEYMVLPPQSLRQRIAGVHGRNYDDKLVPVQETTDVVRIHGFVSKPEYAKKTRGEQYFFVNDRYIKNSYLHHAVVKAYNELIKSEEIPLYYLFFDIDPQRIDINIHPTKTEIKFEDERTIYAILHAAVRSALGRFNMQPSLDFSNDPQFNKFFPQDKEVVPPQISINPHYNPFTNPKGISHKPHSNERQAWTETLQRASADFNELQPDDSSVDVQTKMDLSSAEENASGKSELFQLDKKYIVTHLRGSLLLIHQSAAHQRILFEQFMSHEGHLNAQQLMFPLQVPLKKTEQALAENILVELRNSGFDVNISGGLLIYQATPAGITDFNAETFTAMLIEDISSTGANIQQELKVKIAKSLAATQCIKTGQKLTTDEMNNLIGELFACEEPRYTPDGRPVIVTFEPREVSARFNN